MFDLQIILEAIWLMCPAYFANMAPVICRNILPKFAFPLDFNKSLGGKPILGKNKTFRGLVCGLVFAIIIARIQFLLKDLFVIKSISILDYNNWLIIGILLGSGALTGDAVKSFIKRRMNIAPGNSLAFFDQIDFVVGALAFIFIIRKLDWIFISAAIIVSYALNVIVNYISYSLKIRRDKW